MTIPYEPCKDCDEREVGCHSKCKKYAKFKKEMNDYNDTINHNHQYNFRYEDDTKKPGEEQ